MRKQVIASASALVLAGAVYAGAASASSGAEPMPLTNFTDMPSYHPNHVRCPRLVKCVGKHARRWSWQIEQPQGSR